MADKETPKPMTVQEMASMGGKARAESLTESRRKEIAQNAIAKRWAMKGAKKAVKKAVKKAAKKK
jgi:hypothetical protein